VDNDSTFKEVVECKDCNAYICKPCQKNWFKRGVAYFLKKLGNPVAVQPIEYPTESESEGFPNEETT
jgi:hypothetical protein